MALTPSAHRWAAAMLALLATATFAQPRVDVGKREYEMNCAICHGSDGKGNGPFVELLKRSPPDISTMARRNGGVFPLATVYQVIEGAGGGHGTREMPIWGTAFRVGAAEYHGDAPYNQEAVVRARILALAEYLNRIQAK